MTDRSAWDYQADAQLAQQELQRRFQRIAGNQGQNLLSLLPRPNYNELILVGGSRNRAAKVPAQTRQSLNAALKSAIRAQRAFQQAYERSGGRF